MAPCFSPVLTTSDTAESSAEEDFDLLCSKIALSTFKSVVDNIDFYIRPRQETMDHHAVSLHCTHMMAVKDRVDCSLLSDECRSVDIASVCLADVLPTENDLSALKRKSNHPYFQIC